jgi:predicted RNA binding protein YcfA (HicA-like mRNA interferase family)
LNPPLPAITGEQAGRVAKRAGFRLDRQKGSHEVYLRESDKRRVVIPVHAGKTLKPKTLAGIIRDIGLTPEEFTALL